MPGAYVMTKARYPEEGEAVRWWTTRIASPQRCEHVETICKDCLPLWEEDYFIRVNKTSSHRLGREPGVQLRVGKPSLGT